MLFPRNSSAGASKAASGREARLPIGACADQSLRRSELANVRALQRGGRLAVDFAHARRGDGLDLAAVDDPDVAIFKDPIDLADAAAVDVEQVAALLDFGHRRG